MSATVAQVRTIIYDKARFMRETITTDGASSVIQLQMSPVLAVSRINRNGIPLIPADYTLNGDLGIIAIVVAPLMSEEFQIEYTHSVLSDESITTLISLHDDVRLAAAEAGLSAYTS